MLSHARPHIAKKERVAWDPFLCPSGGLVVAHQIPADKTGDSSTIKIALAPFLRSCPSVVTLGVRACLDDYSQEEKTLLQQASRIFFPTPRFSDIFQALEKPTFPNPTTYRYQRSRILQQLLFQYSNIPQSRSRIYFGTRQKQAILNDFTFPFLALGPLTAQGMTPDSIHIVDSPRALRESLARYNPVIIRQAVEWDEHIQLVCVQYECIGALRCATSSTSRVFSEPIPFEHHSLREPLIVTLDLLRAAHLDDILVEWGYGHGKWQLIEMARPPAHWNSKKGRANRHEHISKLIETGIL